MSKWTDMQKRSSGELKREEDKVEENSWNTKWDIKTEMEKLKKEQIKLSTSLSDLRRELDKFKWNKSKNYTKCNYKI